jgi:hypothetical protein
MNPVTWRKVTGRAGQLPQCSHRPGSGERGGAGNASVV